MQPDSLDRDFRTFQRTRDPGALAAVFDAAAPRLLLVAMHLCRDAATAEDLVQTVFLQVLRDVDRFDSRRPVLPWLLAMLEHRASDLRRSTRVRCERVAEAGVLAKHGSPEHEASASEVRERVAEALAGMPRDYRDVLTLRLVHGLSSVEIAHSQGVPPATVRSRLRRGLELLRGALPRGFATRGLLALLAAEAMLARDGMAAVRAKVLTEAATAAGATTVFGWWVVLAAALLLTVGGWSWFAPAAEPTPVIATDAATAVFAPRGGDRDSHVDARTNDRPVRADQRTLAADPRTTTVRGRVVDADSGMPLAGVVAVTHTYPVGGRASEPDWIEPEPVTTDIDGTFTIAFVPSRQRYVEVLFHADGYVEGAQSFEPLKNGVDIDAGVVSLQRGTPVRLRITCEGRPLRAVEIWAKQTPEGERQVGGSARGVTDDEGIVDLGTCEIGEWQLDLQALHLAGGTRFEVPLQREPFVVDVELRMPPRDRSISGTLVDLAGTPVGGVELALRMPSGGYLTTTTTGDGRFVWSLNVPPPPTVRERIELLRTWGDLEWIEDGREVAWGTHDLRLVVRRRANAVLRLEVFDAVTSQPVESFGATCKANIGSCSAEARRVPVVHHAGGIATFELPPGDYFASVFPEPAFAENAEILVRLEEGRTSTLRVPLRPPAELVVDVVDASGGRPVEGVEVALAKCVPATQARAVSSQWYQALREHPRTIGGGHAASVIVLARGVSDGRGRIDLQAPADLDGLVLIAGGRRCVPCEQHDVLLPQGGASTTLRVTTAGEVRGTVTPITVVERFGPSPDELAVVAERDRTQWSQEDLGDEYARVELRPPGGKRVPELGAHVAADGTFAIGSVPAGRYEVWFVPIVIGHWTAVGPLTVVNVDPATPLPELRLDVPELMPARGTVRCFVDGTPAQGGGGLARLISTGLAASQFEFDGDGLAQTPWLLPGIYVPFVDLGEGRLFSDERIVVTPGGSVNVTCDLHRRQVVLTIVDAEGRPQRDVLVRAESIDRPELGSLHWLRGRSGEDGTIVLDAVPRGRLRVRAFARDQDLRAFGVEPTILLGEVAARANSATFRLGP